MRTAVVLLVVGMLGATAWADGKVFERAAIARPPDTPYQRALLAFDEAKGVETLVIETTVAGEGDEFAWVIPLPASPEITASTAGLFPSLETITAPVVRSAVGPPWALPVILAVGAWGVVRWVGRPRRPAAVLAALASSALLVVLVVSLVSASIMTLGERLPATAAAGARVLAAGTAGVYETTTLTATDAASLRRWLSDHGFAAPEAIDPVVAALLREGWVFVAARVRDDVAREAAGGARRLHPLAFTFPAREAVYPMRLTGVGAGSVALELFALGARRAEADGLAAEYCADGVSTDPRTFFHDELRRRAMGADVLTKLSGRLDAAAMTRDVRVRWTAYAGARTTWYERGVAARRAATSGAPVFAILLCLAAIASRRIASCGTRVLTKFDAASFAVAIAAGATVGAVEYGTIPLVPDGATVSEGTGLATIRRLDEPPEEVYGDLAAIRRWATGATAGGINPLTGEPVREEDSPGNWWIREDGERLTLVHWSTHGRYVVEHTRDVSRHVSFSGSVRTAGGVLVAGGEVRVRASNPEDEVYAGDHFRGDVTTSTGPDGTFRVRLRAGRRWDFAVATAGHPYLLRRGLDPRTTALDFVLPREASLHGRVVDSGGHAVAGTTVIAVPLTPFTTREERSAMTDADGRFEIRGLDAEATLVYVDVQVHGPPPGEATVGRRFVGRLPPEKPFELVAPDAPAR